MSDITISQDLLKQMIDQAVENLIKNAIQHLSQDPIWLEKVERMIAQTLTQRVVAQLNSIDVNSVIKSRVDETFSKKLLKNFSTVGLDDRASQTQVTIFDETTVLENKLTTHSAEVVNDLTVKDLIVKGSINVDNQSWQSLANAVSEKTLDRLEESWRDQLISQVTDQIQKNGISFDQVKIKDDLLVSNDSLSSGIINSNLQSVGILKNLDVSQEIHAYNNTLCVLNKRLGINTPEPEAALSVWDEEISISAGKHKTQEGYIGTNRPQGFNIVMNRDPQISLGTDGITTVKQIRVGSHRIGHAMEVPGWSGTRGDIMFNANPTENSPFAWVCLGAYKWKVIKLDHAS